MGFLIPKLWQILNPFSGAFHGAQTPKLLIVSCHEKVAIIYAFKILAGVFFCCNICIKSLYQIVNYYHDLIIIIIFSFLYILVRWEPPPKESQNGIITGYKIRWRAKSKSHSDIVTTDGSRRLYALTGLKKDREYQIKLAAMTVNGTGPATSW